MSSSKILSVVCILFLSIPVFGQGLVAEGSNWIIRRAYQTDVPGTSYSYYTRNISGEKQYNSRTYKNFLAMSATFTDTIGYLREVNKKVYFKYEPLLWRQGIDTSEFLLYDFGLTMGDTVRLRFDLHSHSFITKYLRFQVIATDSVATISGKHRRLTLYNLDSDTSFLPHPSGWGTFRLCYRDTLTWIETVGSTIGLNYSYNGVNCYTGISSTIRYRTVCHSKEGALWYQPYGVCNAISTRETPAPAVARFYPNPNAGRFVVEVSEPMADSDLRVDIYDFSGTLVFTKELYERRSELSPGIPPGLYVLKLSGGNQMIHHERILIQ